MGLSGHRHPLNHWCKKTHPSLLTSHRHHTIKASQLHSWMPQKIKRYSKVFHAHSRALGGCISHSLESNKPNSFSPIINNQTVTCNRTTISCTLQSRRWQNPRRFLLRPCTPFKFLLLHVMAYHCAIMSEEKVQLTHSNPPTHADVCYLSLYCAAV